MMRELCFILLLSFSLGLVHVDLDEDAPIIDMNYLVDSLPYENNDGGVWKQGWNVQHDPKKWEEKSLEIFVVPHSHNDPGWLMTFEDYYEAKTRHIITNIVNTLNDDPRRHFIWAEISFFSKWWNDQDGTMKEKTRKVLRTGQLEFVTGGWVMNDEATPHYNAIIYMTSKVLTKT
eukprot:TRINITY_DN5796_c0_g1_i2.p1 TRINITY_DN5796_c0_g1~~TRINITY_DN5796_c0_g1_i2.p1  ORF type:complete len:175 (-),score=37.76 TRINITY_DN5796_c0_g1_i2:91-615(-)